MLDSLITLHNSLLEITKKRSDYWFSVKYTADSRRDSEWSKRGKAGFVIYLEARDLLRSLDPRGFSSEEEYVSSVLYTLDVHTSSDRWGIHGNWLDEINSDTVAAVIRDLTEALPTSFVNKYLRIRSGRRAHKIFISYSSEDSAVVDKISAKLDAAALDIWLDKKRIGLGDEIHSSISQGIIKSDFFCIFLSRASICSKWVSAELRQAIDKSHEDGSKILPILIGDCQPPGYLRGLHYGQLREPFDVCTIDSMVVKIVNSIDNNLIPLDSNSLIPDKPKRHKTLFESSVIQKDTLNDEA